MNLKVNTSELFSSKNRVGTKVGFVFNLVGNLIQICIIIATETIQISYQKCVSQKIHYTITLDLVQTLHFQLHYN